MAIYFYWGEDSFAIAQAVKTLQRQTLDPMWESFNFDKLSPDQPDAIVQALNQSMTPPFGTGKRFVWIAETSIAQRCSEELLQELDRTLPVIPDTTTLLLTSSTKPDGRLKSTKLLQKYATLQEFSPIPPWKTDLIVKQVQTLARLVGVKLTPDAIEYLADAVGNNTQQLSSELEKLATFANDAEKPLNAAAIAPLVTASTQNALQLVAAIRLGKTSQALELISDLLRHNEPALRIVSTLVGQFRLRLWIKIMLEAGERDEHTIAKAVELSGNPKQIYFLRQELNSVSLRQLQRVLPILLELEFNLKRSADEALMLQTKIIELCEIFRN